MSKIKIITIGIITFLLILILGLVWNIGRNQRPSQQLVDNLTNTFNNSQNSQNSSSPDFGDAQITNFSQNNSTTNSQNSTSISQTISQITNSGNISSNSQTNSQSLEVPSFRSSQNIENSSETSSIPNILGDSATWDRYIFNEDEELGDNFILQIPTQESPDPKVLKNYEPVFGAVFDPNAVPQENFYLTDKREHWLIGKGLFSVSEFELENQKYWLTVFGDLFGTKKFFLSGVKFENPREIKILPNEIITKVEKVESENGVFKIITQDGNGRNPTTKTQQIDLKKVVANPGGEVILEEIN